MSQLTNVNQVTLTQVQLGKRIKDNMANPDHIMNFEQIETTTIRF